LFCNYSLPPSSTVYSKGSGQSGASGEDFGERFRDLAIFLALVGCGYMLSINIEENYSIFLLSRRPPRPAPKIKIRTYIHNQT
jgi:hypothetical protein